MPRLFRSTHPPWYCALPLVSHPMEGEEDDTGWSPYLSLEGAKKLDAVRLALRRGEIAEAAKHGRVFELKPISV
jgi:hypothetical protein